MKHHCRCLRCEARRKLRKHPLEYLRKQPKCHKCGYRLWRRDNYRHAIEVPQMRLKIDRYRVCHADCHHHPHRMASNGCKFEINGEYRTWLD